MKNIRSTKVPDCVIFASANSIQGENIAEKRMLQAGYRFDENSSNNPVSCRLRKLLMNIDIASQLQKTMAARKSELEGQLSIESIDLRHRKALGERAIPLPLAAVSLIVITAIIPGVSLSMILALWIKIPVLSLILGQYVAFVLTFAATISINDAYLKRSISGAKPEHMRSILAIALIVAASSLIPLGHAVAGLAVTPALVVLPVISLGVSITLIMLIEVNAACWAPELADLLDERFKGRSYLARLDWVDHKLKLKMLRRESKSVAASVSKLERFLKNANHECNQLMDQI
jgi:hypothetical protein